MFDNVTKIYLPPAHDHGGRLHQAAVEYHRPIEDWLDLSTAINPQGFQPPSLPERCWQRLPEENDGLELAASRYYGCTHVLMTAGSQAVIQVLPQLRDPCAVGLFAPSYSEHAQAWQSAGHQLHFIDEQQEPPIEQLDVLVVVNPNNPTGRVLDKARLLAWHQQLAAKGGWLVVDEAFIDCTPEKSLMDAAPQPGLVLLRSLGKFFGLAGIRAGAVAAETALLDEIYQKLGPWSLSHPARWVAAQAFADETWQQETRKTLADNAQRLKALLINSFQTTIRYNALFASFQHPQAAAIYEALAQEGVLVRLFAAHQILRFGLPGNPDEWQRLELTLNKIAL